MQGEMHIYLEILNIMHKPYLKTNITNGKCINMQKVLDVIHKICKNRKTGYDIAYYIITFYIIACIYKACYNEAYRKLPIRFLIKDGILSAVDLIIGTCPLYFKESFFADLSL